MEIMMERCVTVFFRGLGYLIGCILYLIVCLGGCTPSNPEGGPGGTGGSSSSSSEGTGGNSTGPTSGGVGGSSGDSNSVGGSAGSDFGDGGEAGDPGTSSSVGGSSSSSGGSAGDSSTNGGLIPLGRLDPIDGPVEDNETPLELGVTYTFPEDFECDLRTIVLDTNRQLYCYGDSFYVNFEPNLMKFDIDRQLQWSTPSPLSFSSVSSGGESPPLLAWGTDDTLLVAGIIDSALEGETLAGGYDSVSMKLDAEGNLRWAHQWGSQEEEDTIGLFAGPEGSIVTLTATAGQPPGNPPGNVGGEVLARYEADGTRSLLRQTFYKDWALLKLLVNEQGTLYSFAYNPDRTDYGIVEFDASGEEVRFTPLSSFFTWNDLHFSFGPEQQSFYVYGVADEGDGSFQVVARLALDGTILWYRPVISRSAILDEVEGTTWHGNFGADLAGYSWILDIVSASDSIYLIGSYANTYELGSTRPDNNQALYVGRYDFEGNRLWFSQFRTNTVTSIGAKLFLDAEENPTVLSVTDRYMIHLDKEDGSLF